MSEQPTPPPRQRRSSFVDFFGGRGNSAPTPASAVSSSPPSTAVPAPPTAPQHRRGVSISTLGLTGGGAGGAQGQTNPYTAFARQRRASVAGSSASSSPEFKNSFGDEPVVLEEDDISRPPANTPASPFARRLSFGAQALRDVKSSGPGSPGAGEGFNWSEALRDRTKRSPSFSGGNPFAANASKPRPPSAAVAEPPKEMPKPVEPQPMRMKKPDHLGERMLRGDFMMD